MRVRLLLFIVVIISISTVTAVSFAQRTRDTADKPITGDFKITIKNTIAGNTSQGTTMIKGGRQREETTMSMAGMNQTQISITQCDLQRTIQINESSRRYLITPLETDEGDSSGAGHATGTTGSAQRGGVVILMVNTVDTGERKEMFGFTARHLKRTTMMEPGPGACSQQKMKIENDGWYINLEYGIACETSRPSQMGAMSQGCRDRYQYRRTGPTKLGFPLVETTTMYGDDGRANFTMTKEVLDLSRQTLDAALFEVPAGYTQVASQQEMYGAPSMDQIMAQAREQSGQGATPAANPNSTSAVKANPQARVKVGVVEFNNKAKASVSTDSLRQQLITVLNGNGIDAVALNASSASEAALEAKAKGCAYILYTDISMLKAASAGKKFGGFLNKATGAPSGDGKSEAKLDFRLVSVDGGSPKLQSSASAKEDSVDASVNSALQEQARAVTGALGGN